MEPSKPYTVLHHRLCKRILKARAEGLMSSPLLCSQAVRQDRPHGCIGIPVASVSHVPHADTCDPSGHSDPLHARRLLTKDSGQCPGGSDVVTEAAGLHTAQVLQGLGISVEYCWCLWSFKGVCLMGLSCLSRQN